MPSYAIEVHRTVVFRIEFEAVDDDEADGLHDDDEWIDDMIGDLSEQDVSLQKFGVERIDG